MDTITVYDTTRQQWVHGTVGDTLAAKPGAKMVEWIPDYWGRSVSIVIYDTGDIMLPADWQGAQPKCAEDIPYTTWLDARGQTCVILDGWPVSF